MKVNPLMNEYFLQLADRIVLSLQDRKEAVR